MNFANISRLSWIMLLILLSCGTYCTGQNSTTMGISTTMIPAISTASLALSSPHNSSNSSNSSDSSDSSDSSKVLAATSSGANFSIHPTYNSVSNHMSTARLSSGITNNRRSALLTTIVSTSLHPTSASISTPIIASSIIYIAKEDEDTTGLSKTQIAGIAGGASAAFVLFIVLIIVVLCMRSSRKNRTKPAGNSHHDAGDNDNMEMAQEEHESQRKKE